MLWPRQEVLALTITQLSNIGGKLLSNSLVLSVVRQLSKAQSPEGKITYDRWLVVAKDLLKWNDSCIQLFWEMLITALWYTDENAHNIVYDSPVDTSIVALFLVLHASDTTARPNSPAAAYNTIWPSNADMEPMAVSSQMPLSPMKTVGSNSNSISGLSIRAPPSVGSPGSGSLSSVSLDVRSPKSPRSPKSQMSTVGAMSPPGRSSVMSLHSPRHGKTASAGQTIFSLKQKLPFILRSLAVATEDESSLPSVLFASADSHDSSAHGGHNHQSSASSTPSTSGVEFMLSRRAIDSLGLIFGGGNNREEQVTSISSLHPLWSAESDSESSSILSVPYSEVVEWVDSNLCVNDLFYPSAANAGVFVGAQPQSQSLSFFSNYPPPRRAAATGINANNANANAALIGFDDLSLHLSDSRDASGGAGGSSSNNNNSTAPHSPPVSGYGQQLQGAGGSSSISISINTSSSSSSGGGSASGSGPTQIFTPVSSLSRAQPVVVSGCSSTYMHVVTAAAGGGGGAQRQRKAAAAVAAAAVTPIGVRGGVDGLADVADGDGDDDDFPDVSGLRVKPSASVSSNMSVEPEGESCSATATATASSKGAATGLKSQTGVKRGPEAAATDDSESMDDGDNDNDDDHSSSEDGATPRLGGGGGGGGGGVARGGGGGGGLSLSLSKAQIEDVVGAVQGRSRFALPQVLLTGCHKAPLYFLGPYSSVFISGCNDCDIVVGAVAGIVVVSGCERIRLSVSCRKLIVHNSLECEFSTASLSPAVISGDSRSLVFGPLNVSYRHLPLHLRMADLGLLLTAAAAAAGGTSTSNSNSAGQSPSSSQSSPADTSTPLQQHQQQQHVSDTNINVNCWSVMCDVTACMENQASSSGAGSPSGYAIDAADRLQFSLTHLPPPPQSTAAVMSPQKYKFLSIPLRTENQPPELCPVTIPQLYRSALASRGAAVADISRKLQLLSAAAGGATGRNKSSNSSSSSSSNDIAEKLAGDLNERFVLASGAPSHHSSRKSSSSSGSGASRAEPDDHGDTADNSVVSPSRFITAKFTEWLISTGKVHHLIDLVRLDAERASGGRLSVSKNNDQLEAVSVSTSNSSTARSST